MIPKHHRWPSLAVSKEVVWYGETHSSLQDGLRIKTCDLMRGSEGRPCDEHKLRRNRPMYRNPQWAPGRIERWNPTSRTGDTRSSELIPFNSDVLKRYGGRESRTLKFEELRLRRFGNESALPSGDRTGAMTTASVFPTGERPSSIDTVN